MSCCVFNRCRFFPHAERRDPAGPLSPSRRGFWLPLAAYLLSCVLYAEPALAQQIDPAQELLRQQERERALRQRQESSPDVRLQTQNSDAANRLPSEESPCFIIRQIVLSGDQADRFQTALSAAERTPSGEADAASGRCLGTRGINLVMARIQNAIMARGFVTTRILAEAQDLSSGTLKLTVIPGRIRTIRFSADTDSRATKWNAVAARPGDVLNLRDIEQSLENFKRVPSADADIQIVPAEGPDSKPGESDLVIAWRQGFPFRLTVSADDSGSKSTGKYQAGLTLSYDHWWTLNDLFYLSLNQDLGGGDAGERGTRGFTAHYSVPFGYWLVGLTASRNRYHQSVAGANQTYMYSGESRSSEIKLSRLIYRDAVRKTTINLRGWSRSSQNFIDDTEIEVQRRRMAGWDLGVGHREFIGTSTLDLNLNYRRGTGAMRALPAPEEAFDEGTSRPQIMLADMLVTIPFAVGEQRLRYSGNWRAQWNRTPLIPQDRFAIGGRYTVRGFDGENVLSAERGWLIRNDLGWALGQSGQELYLGIDHGQVSGPSSKALVGTHLSGAVVGLRGSYKGLSYDVFVGRPINKPAGFETASSVTGFNLNWSF